MANSFVLFENIFEDGTITPSGTAAGFPASNVLDWRMATPFRWKDDATGILRTLDVDLGAGNTAQPDTVAIGGHNITATEGIWKIQYSDNGSTWADAFSDITPTDDMPAVKTFTVGAGHQYWRLRIAKAGGLTVVPQIGILTLGRRLDFEEGPQPDLDPYGEEVVADGSDNEHGSPIGENVRYVRKAFRINHATPGMTKTGFYDPATGLGWDDDFMPHLRARKPFWFAWNVDEQADGVYLCRADPRVSMPFVGTTARRSLITTFIGYREVS